MAKVLIIAAHPDDEILGVGGTIAKHADDGDSVHIMILSFGYPSKYDIDFPNKQMVNATKASRLLGLEHEPYFSEICDIKKRLDEIPLSLMIWDIEQYISKIKPSILYIHHRGDANTDHRIAFEVAICASRIISPYLVKEILCFETLSSTEQAPPFPEYVFQPNIYINIEKHLEKKIEAMKYYSYELRDYPHPRSIESIRLQAKVRGHESGCKAAEAFMLVREII